MKPDRRDVFIQTENALGESVRTKINFKDLKKGDIFSIEDYVYRNGSYRNCNHKVLIAASDPYLNENGILTIKI
jgi:hypothetical protein